jgi:uncharacterized repeat protein (TIGR01451 family)
VTGEDVAGTPVSDTDPSHYFGFVSAIDVEKSTNGQDADAAPGVYLTVGDPVTWTYTVTNPGDLAILNVALIDDQGVTPIFQSGDTNGDNRLDTDETWVYEAAGTAVAGQYTNLATVSGVDAFEDAVTDSDPSNYFAFIASISIEKTPDVEVVEFGDPHTFTIEVTNTGDSVLTDVEVTDPVTPSCDRVLGDMQAGEVIGYTCDIASVTTLIHNVALVEGTALDDTPRTDDDDATVSPIGIGGTGSIGDTVWADENGNGIQDNGEKGIANAKVTVRFISGPNSNFVQQADQVITTDANGWYLAVGLVEGVWESELNMTSVEGSLTTPGKYTIQLAGGEEYLDADFGLEGSLPATGSDLDRYVNLGLLLLLVGTALVAATIFFRRRPSVE